MFGRKKYWIFLIPSVLALITFWTDRSLVKNLNSHWKAIRYGVLARKDRTVGERSRFCNSKTEPFWQEGFEDENNTAWPWNYSVTWNCPLYQYNNYQLHRRKVYLDCSTGSPHLVVTLTNTPSDIQVVEPGSSCLLSYIQNCCNDKGQLVPNVLHYIWYSDIEVGFYTFVSLISAIRFVKPCLILFHGPYIPKGKFWNFFIGVYPNVVLVNETLIVEVFGHALEFKEHGADLMRIKALQEYGGIYIDWDSVFVKPIEPLRKYNFSMSLEEPIKLGNQLIMAEPNATFLTHYYNGYKDYRPTWIYNSMKYPFKLTKKYPDTIHVEKYTGIKPKQKGVSGPSLYYRNSDWSNNYALHFYVNDYEESDDINITTVRRLNTTIGAACRRVLFGRKEMCES